MKKTPSFKFDRVRLSYYLDKKRVTYSESASNERAISAKKLLECEEQLFDSVWSAPIPRNPLYWEDR